MISQIYEAILFGIVTIILGLFFCIIFVYVNPSLPPPSKEWDKFYVMESVLFVTGFSFYYMLSNFTVQTYYPILFSLV